MQIDASQLPHSHSCVVCKQALNAKIANNNTNASQVTNLNTMNPSTQSSLSLSSMSVYCLPCIKLLENKMEQLKDQVSVCERFVDQGLELKEIQQQYEKGNIYKKNNDNNNNGDDNGNGNIQQQSPQQQPKQRQQILLQLQSQFESQQQLNNQLTKLQSLHTALESELSSLQSLNKQLQTQSYQNYEAYLSQMYKKSVSLLEEVRQGFMEGMVRKRDRGWLDGTGRMDVLGMFFQIQVDFGSKICLYDGVQLTYQNLHIILPIFSYIFTQLTTPPQTSPPIISPPQILPKYQKKCISEIYLNQSILIIFETKNGKRSRDKQQSVLGNAVNWVNYVIVEINGIYGYLDIRETSTNVNVNINNNKFDSRLIFQQIQLITLTQSKTKTKNQNKKSVPTYQQKHTILHICLKLRHLLQLIDNNKLFQSFKFQQQTNNQDKLQL